MDIKNASLKRQAQLKKSIELSKETAYEIAAYLDQKKAIDITIIDIFDQSIIADFFVVCSAKSTTAVKALSDHIDEKLSKKGIEPKARDIDPKWAAIDYNGVILHIFYEETRSVFKLEKLWDNGQNIKIYQPAEE
ncbi:MAG: ribosome silencing factor [Firmicutes bacterium]|nr:ribosome silencing factor [Bacillota bacterium]